MRRYGHNTALSAMLPMRLVGCHRADYLVRLSLRAAFFVFTMSALVAPMVFLSFEFVLSMLASVSAPESFWAGPFGAKLAMQPPKVGKRCQGWGHLWLLPGPRVGEFGGWLPKHAISKLYILFCFNCRARGFGPRELT